MSKKICVVSGTRAEYGLLYWLMKEIENDKELSLQLIVTAMHLSPEFGETYKEIEKEFTINKKIEMLLSSDTSIGISKSMGLAQISFAEAFDELKPDLIIILGDRYEILSAASVALISNIPIAHIHGGEITEGAFDDAIRHSITKMSHLHFTSTDEYRNRVIQLGEQPNLVFNVGGMGIENIKRLTLLSKEDFEKSIDFKLNKKNILVTFHPVTLEKESAEKQFKELISSLDVLADTSIIFTKANSDTEGRKINNLIEQYVEENKHKAVCFSSLGQLRYLSALQYIDIVIGNSSSGILEVPSFKKATINIGNRQKGRISAKSVINCEPTKINIDNAIKKAYSSEFKEKLKTIQNPYEQDQSSKKIINTIKSVDLKQLINKKFYDISGE
eukprot:TRINITY_DN3789_c0_g3_i1.p1 TRINITY_DN3789_c0_g3~~TRINITY_DN3789_c0_g3_i1.p1  ORF type:complete len:388 (-),score=65.55 TRINITY_DN3789_c0_g3_i1:957-2120(-)